MTKVKTSELTGKALDWAVAKCEEYLDAELTYSNGTTTTIVMIDEFGRPYDMRFGVAWRPSTSWEQGGPLIERERITLSQGRDLIASIWQPSTGPLRGDRYRYKQLGPTPLIAAMRCFVASKLGDEVEIPEELL